MEYPLGIRRDGSYYTRIEWASHTESDPTFWVVNLIRDDTLRNGGTWGANYSDTDEPRKLRRQEDTIDSVPWQFLTRVNVEKAEGWQEIRLEVPVRAKYLRFDLVENHGTPPDIPWTELSEIKIYP